MAEDIIENFCVSICLRVAYKTIKVYLCGVQYWSKLQGGTTLIKNMPRLHYVKTAIRRVQGSLYNKPARTPVTWHMLERICAFIASTESAYDGEMLTSAVLLAFFALLRVSEYTTPSSSTFDDSTHLTVSDVAVIWTRQIATINIKVSKTDPFREGVCLKIGMLNHYLCPVRALARYLLIRGPRPGPLYIFRNGAHLTRARIHDLLARALPEVQNINTHSFRRGGASALAAAGTPDTTIRVLGRWKSNAYAEYIEYTDAFFITANRAMSRPARKDKEPP